MTAPPAERVGRYQLVDPIGVGPTGSVSRAKVFGVAGLERQFAVKRFHAEVTASPQLAAALSAAARSYGSLEHPRIARMTEFGVARGTTYTAIELVAGIDAMRLITESRLAGVKLAVGGALALVSQAARAIGFAHGRGLAHLGIAPTNVIVTADGDLKITDFGICAATLPPGAFQPERPDGIRLAQRAGYLAPEQLLGDPVSAATDVFALGVLAYELVTGGRAFRGASPRDVMASVLAGPPDELPLPRPIARVIQRCLARSPFERFPDARAFADALDAAIRLAPVPGTRRDIGALVSSTLERLATLRESEQSGMLAFNVGTGPFARPLGVRPEVLVPGPTPLVGPTRPGSSPVDADDHELGATKVEVMTPMKTVTGLPPMPIPVPSLAAPPLTGPSRFPVPRAPTASGGPPRFVAATPSTLIGANPPAKPPGRPTGSMPVVGPPRPSSGTIPNIAPRPGTDLAIAVAADLTADRDDIDATEQMDREETMLSVADDDAVIELEADDGDDDEGDGDGDGDALETSDDDDDSDDSDDESDDDNDSDDDEGDDDSDDDEGDDDSNDSTVPSPPVRASGPGATMPGMAVAGGRELLTEEMSPILVTKLNAASTRPTRDLPPLVRDAHHANALAEFPDELHVSTLDATAAAAARPRRDSAQPAAVASGDEPGRNRAAIVAGVVLGVGALAAGAWFAYARLRPAPSVPSTEPAIVVRDAAGATDQPRADAPTSTVVAAPNDATVDAIARDAAITDAAARDAAALDATPRDATAPDAAAPDAPLPLPLPLPLPPDAAPPRPDAATAVIVSPIGPVPVTPGSGLAIASTPAGATVYLDGANAGVTPLSLAATPAGHSLAIALSGYALFLQKIPGSGTIAAPLVPVPRWLGNAGIKVLKCAPDRYYITVDGKPTGMLCPTERINTTLGPHTVDVYDLVTGTSRTWHVTVPDERLSVRIRVE